MNKAVYMQRSFCLGSILSILLILAGLTSTFDSASAQSGIGSIEGTVTDPTGAVVPGAAIHVVNTGTRVAVDAKSNGAGFFQVSGLFTGTYALTVTFPGMKTYQTSLELLVSQTAVINPRLTIGAETQTVTVGADTVQLTTNDSASISSTLEYQRINQLPENGREITTLLQDTTPGLENTSKNTGGNINGLNPEALSYTVDGANLGSNEFGGLQFGLIELIDPDAIQEAHVESSNSGAQYASPATVVMSTRSGTRDLHGNLFETARNNAFGVAKPRQAVADYVAPQLIRNEFGVSGGGPVVLPHVYRGRDKTFWFFAYERYSDAEQLAGLASVPTYGTPGMTGPGAGMNNGDFSSLVNGAGVLQTLYDPATTASSAACAGSPNAAGKSVANPYCRTPLPQQPDPNQQGITLRQGLLRHYSQAEHCRRDRSPGPEQSEL